MNHRPSRKLPRKRLSFWRFLLALLIGLFTWWGVGQLTEPRPLWTIWETTGHQVILPLSESADFSRLVAYELKLNPVNAVASTVTGIVILDASNGQTLYRLPLPDDPWQPDQFILQSDRQALPRIIGDVLWRIKSVETDKVHRHELRVWHYTLDLQEKIIQSWYDTSGTTFDFAFASSVSPYLITQTRHHLEPWLAALGTEGWSSLAAQMVYAQSVDMTGDFSTDTRGIAPTPKRPDPVISSIHTWKLPARIDDALQPLTGWVIPRQTVWPPVCGMDMSWLAFGDSPSRQALNADNVQPLGVLLFDGHTGKPRSHNLPSTLPMHVSAAGNLLLATSFVNSNGQAREHFQHHLVDAQTGKDVALPAELASARLPLRLFADQTLPGRLLASMGLYGHPFVDRDFQTGNGTPMIELLQRIESGLGGITPLTSLTIQEPQKYGMTHIAGNELGVFGSVDTAPPLLREMAEKWDWLKSWVTKTWPSSAMTLMLFDISTGKPLRQFRDVMVTQLNSASPRKLLYTLRYRREPQNGREAIDALDAWQLPIETMSTSAWWGRLAGILITLMAALFLRRKDSC